MKVSSSFQVYCAEYWIGLWPQRQGKQQQPAVIDLAAILIWLACTASPSFQSQDYHTTYRGFVPENYPARGPSTQDLSDSSVSYHLCLGCLSRFKVFLVKKCLYKLQELPYTHPTTTIKIFVRILPSKMHLLVTFGRKKNPVCF